MQIFHIANHRPCHARRRDALVVCPSCGRSMPRKARQQIYCSTPCRQRANYAKAVAEGRFEPPLTKDTVRPTNPPKKVNGINALRAPKSGSSIAPERWRAIVELEVFGGRRWQAVVSSDGLTCEVSLLRPRARDGGAP